jgi:hypothetical protein
LQCCEIELIEIVLWFVLYRRSELFFLLGKIAFCARQPTSNDMKGCAVPISRRDSIKRFAGDIELPKAERRGGKVELTLRVFWQQSRYAFAPRNGFFEILFFRCVRQDRQRCERIRMPAGEFLRHLRCFAELSLL